VRCPHCEAEIPDVSRFCLSCGKEVPPPKSLPVQEDDNPDPHGHAMILIMLSFMVFFFMLVPIFLGLWIGAGLMAGIGCVLVIAGIYVLRSNKKHIERMREESAVKVKCRYCGSLSDQAALKCESCGATL
jgi:hypothetical protein